MTEEYEYVTEECEKWIKWTKENEYRNIPPMTRTQVEFAEWLLAPENFQHIDKIGDVSKIFESIYSYSKLRKS